MSQFVCGDDDAGEPACVLYDGNGIHLEEKNMIE